MTLLALLLDILVLAVLAGVYFGIGLVVFSKGPALFAFTAAATFLTFAAIEVYL